MLEDRSYMRGPSLGPRWSAAIILLLVNVGIFIIQSLVERHSANGRLFITQFFYLSLDGLSRGFIWQLVTFQFLHGGVFHLLGNVIAIFFLGRGVEEAIGPRSFLKLYFTAGIVGGLVQMSFAAVLPGQFGGAVVGASAGALGLVAAYATMFPHRQLTILLFFFLPISMYARTLLWIAIGISIFGMVMLERGIAHAAHLGGIIAGVLYIRYIVEERLKWRGFSSPKKSGNPRIEVIPPKRNFWRSSKAAEPENLPSDEFMRREVDPILDKISQHGIHSLTEHEKQILETARNRMAKR